MPPSRSDLDGTEGYAEEAASLVRQMESMSFEALHARIIPLLPSPPATILDVGAGTGRDAAALSDLGYDVTAVEPVRELRKLAGRDDEDGPIRWVDDRLPDLPALKAAGASSFSVVLMSAVWMHLGPGDRITAMARIASLLQPGGLLALTLRHGPIPAGRHMFPVPDTETLALAASAGLAMVQHVRTPDALGRQQFSWSAFAFRLPLS